MSKEEIIEGLQKRLDWMITNKRPLSEIVQIIEIIVNTAARIFDKEQMELFCIELSDKLIKNKK